MVSSIIARKFKDDDQVNLSLRLATPSLKNAIALNITIDTDRWLQINKSLKLYAKSYKSGADIVIDDSLKSKLWTLLKEIELKNEAGTLDLNTARATIRNVLHQERMKEMEHQKAESEQQNDEEKHVSLMEWIETFIGQCESGERLKQKSIKKITPGTIKTYRGTLAQLKEYQQKRHRIIDFDDMTLDFYEDWRRFFLEKKNKKGESKPYSPNTIGKHVKNLKIFLYAAKEMKLTTRNDFESSRFSADSVDVENVYLTEERLQEMYETDFEDEATIKRLMRLAPSDGERRVLKDQLTRRTPRLLNEAKDIFTVGCLTGQRVSDYKRINESMYRTLSDNNDYIYLQQDKTGKWIYIPLDLRVRAIVAKYGGKLPHCIDQDLNERVKVIGRLLGWRENAGIKELHGTMEVPTQKKFYECLMTHTARRTFATNAYKRKISLSSIMVITGHSSEKMLRKYLKLDNEERAILAAAEFNKAKEVKLKIAE
jgi:integrase